MLDLTKGFGSLMGTNQYYRHGLVQKVVYTDGIKDMADKRKCHWVINLIASYQVGEPCKSTPHQTWKIVAKDEQAVATCFDTCNDKKLVEQNVGLTTLPDGEMLIYATHDDTFVIIGLPIEG